MKLVGVAIMVLVMVAPQASALWDVSASTPPVISGFFFTYAGECYEAGPRYSWGGAYLRGETVPYGEAGAYWREETMATNCWCDPTYDDECETERHGTHAAVGVADTDGDDNGDTPYVVLLA